MKKIISAVLAAVLICSVLALIPTTVSAESLYIRKIVSVVCDDSGSMGLDKTDPNSKWAYANYALQAFCGMLNSDDKLFVTYMSAPHESEEVDLSAGAIQSSVDNIKSKSPKTSTPYQSVITAFDKLKNTADSNPNTQYWLVVITDGNFDRDGIGPDDKAALNSNLNNYVSTQMPNGSTPQVTFLGIGNGVTMPDEDAGKGIYTYTAADAPGIIQAMSSMADRISGRTRLNPDSLKLVGDDAIQVSSAIPLLNIVVFVQGSDAKVSRASYGNSNIPVSRQASLSYPVNTALVGGAFLIGDSQRAIDSGTYTIKFDKKISMDDVVVLFEPALEARMTISLNGKELSNFNALADSMESDRVSVSYKIYEMGTDKEIDPSLMPTGTELQITVRENGQEVYKVSGAGKFLSDYTLKNIETEITASVIIDGFNPIECTAKFTPTEYVKRVVYTVAASYGGDSSSVKAEQIGSNKDMSILFTVYADGVEVTDPEEVKALNPVITVSPDGDDGVVTYSSDGKIVFTPNKASATVLPAGSYDVDVQCTLDNGATASGRYTVETVVYLVVPIEADSPIKKTELFGNQVSTSFYITKDGVKLSKAAIEGQFSVLLNEEYSSLKYDIDLADDGTVTVTPYSEDQYTLTPWTWFTNWIHYFGLSGKDITVTLSSAFGEADSTIKVTGEGAVYLLLNVFLPLLLEIAWAVVTIIYIVTIVNKPRYVKGAKLYVGQVYYYDGKHTISNFRAKNLYVFNKIKKGNGRLKFKKTADFVNVNGLSIRAEYGGGISCEMTGYECLVIPVSGDSELETPEGIANAGSDIDIRELDYYEDMEDVTPGTKIFACGSSSIGAQYLVFPDRIDETYNGRKVIGRGYILAYVI